MKTRARITLNGIVQGVGFRPFVHRLGKKYGLCGWIRNTTQGVVIEAEGERNVIDGFYGAILKKSPAPSRIRDKKIFYLPPRGYEGFNIEESSSCRERTVLVSPDISVCSKCLSEVEEPSDRRFAHPFINCTDCGPRFTLLEDLPYDRRKTAMKKFKMCRACRAEYSDISRRRYHAQPIACNDCGPAVSLLRTGAHKAEFNEEDAVRHCARLLERGKIVAIKGLGGFHLACDASSRSAVIKLRKRKKRFSKPFAVMCRDLASARKSCFISSEEEEMLCGWQKPIVLCKKRKSADNHVAWEVAPKIDSLGVMLPYTPLHHLLFRALNKKTSALVMTSANLSDLPIEIDNEKTVRRLSAIADYFLLHDRDIRNRCDDSVLRFTGKTPVILRRARGFVPLPFEAGFNMKEMLACGAELMNTFCITKGKNAFMSQYVGDLKNYETFRYYADMVRKFERMFDIKPKVVAHDMHPDYFSTKFAAKYSGICRLVPVQHHHAHVASCMLENDLKGRVIGVAFDGTGYGLDGNIWGGEFLVCSLKSFERAGHLEYVPMPGGDRAVEEPWRMGISYLYGAFGKELPGVDFVRRYRKEIPAVVSMIEKKINLPLTSGAGRLFDAVSAMLGICYVNTYEAQAAMELESAASAACRTAGGYGYGIAEENGIYIIKTSPVIEGITEDIKRGSAKAVIAVRFHYTMADIICKMCMLLKKETGIRNVALSGGVFQNRLLLERSVRLLAGKGFRCHYNRRFPANDGGISLGQVAVASALK